MVILVKNARLSFFDLLAPKKVGSNGDEKFRVKLICEDDTTLVLKNRDDEGKVIDKKEVSFTNMKKICDKVYEDRFGKLDAVFTNWAYNPADGSGTRPKFVDKKTGEYRAGVSADSMLIDATVLPAQLVDSKKNPEGKLTVVDQSNTPIMKGDKRLYSGCYVDASIDVYAYFNNDSGNSIAASLKGVKLRSEGERFVGGPQINVEDEFEDIEVDESEEGSEDDWE